MCTWHQDHSLYRIGILGIPKLQFLPQFCMSFQEISLSQTRSHDRRRRREVIYFSSSTQGITSPSSKQVLGQGSYKPRSMKRFESHLWLEKFQVFAMTFAKDEEINAKILTDMMDLIRWSKACVSILGYCGKQTQRKYKK